MSMTLSRAFNVYGARLANIRWANSAIAGDGAVVMSCWKPFLDISEPGVLRYRDALSRWRGPNPVGADLLGKHLGQALEQDLPVRLVIATAEDAAAIDRGDTSKVTEFHAKKTHTGRVLEYDGDKFIVEFRVPRGPAAR
jgi:hypothetical protein